MTADEKQCQCGRCFFQVQFVPIVLGGALLLSGGFCVFIMLRFRDEADIVWAQGIFKEIMAAFLVSLVTSRSNHQGDTVKAGDNTTIVQTPTPVAAPEPQP